jgi:predicted small secreted protein
MKKYSVLLAVLVLTACLFTGCGCTRRGAGTDTMPATEMTILPTNIPETTAPLLPETEMPTMPMTEAPTDMATEDATMDTGDGISDNAAGTEGARSRMK